MIYNVEMKKWQVDEDHNQENLNKKQQTKYEVDSIVEW